MVSAISSFDPIAYLKQLGNTSSTNSASSEPAADDGTTSSSPAATNTTGASALPSNPLNLSPTVLAVLQEIGDPSSGSSLMSGLLGNNTSSVSSSDPLAGVYSTLLYRDTKALPIQEAVQSSADSNGEAADNDPVQSLIDNYNAALNANNQAVFQEVQSALQASNITLPISA